MEIEKVLTISSIHIKESTADLLTDEPKTNTLGLCVYSKADYGWFIYINETAVDYARNKSIPDDLASVILFAHDLGCKILCLDCDGEVLPYLKKYDW